MTDPKYIVDAILEDNYKREDVQKIISQALVDIAIYGAAKPIKIEWNTEKKQIDFIYNSEESGK